MFQVRIYKSTQVRGQRVTVIAVLLHTALLFSLERCLTPPPNPVLLIYFLDFHTGRLTQHRDESSILFSIGNSSPPRSAMLA